MTKKGKRVKNANGETPMPEEVIHHVQSFMSGKEAARSAFLSKSWYAAWLTRPTIDLDEADFDYPDGGLEFGRFAKKIMKRYQTLNLKIESFRLHSHQRSQTGDLALELIANAIKIGATHLQLDVSRINSQEMLLSLNYSNVDGKGNCVINFSTLKFLTLRSVAFWGFKDIISSCISMEELSLSESRGLRLGQSIELHKLRRLSMCAVKVDALFFTDFASRFPCLKDLTLHDCVGCNRINIASTSLQTISFKPRIKTQKAKFELPNILKFTYLGDHILPSYLSINVASSREWELDVSIAYYHEQVTSWFMNLKRLLNKFKRSKISLFIDLCGYWNTVSDRTVDIEAMPKPLVVENLTILARSTFCCSLLHRLLGAFRPKFINICESGNYIPIDRKVEGFDTSYESLIHALFVSSCQEKGLKNLNVQTREEFDTEWQTLKLKKALAVSEAMVRLQSI